MVLSGCGSDGGADTSQGITDTTVADSSATDDTQSVPTEGSEDPSEDIAIEGGTATLTIGDQTFEFDAFLCAFGHEANQRDEVAFGAGGTGTDGDGNPVQIGVELHDAGLREGWTIVYLLRPDDSGDFKITWAMSDSEPLAVEDPTGRAVSTVDGDNLTIEGGDYERIEDGEETGEIAQGSLTGVCSPDSLR